MTNKSLNFHYEKYLHFVPNHVLNMIVYKENTCEEPKEKTNMLHIIKIKNENNNDICYRVYNFGVYAKTINKHF